MAEYIERKVALAAIRERCAPCGEGIEALKASPAADVAPVVHGQWDGDECSVCKLPWNYYMTQNADDWGYFDPMPDYCPNCGAKMDEVSQ